MALNPYASTQGASNLGLGGNQYGGSNPYLQQNIDNTMGDITRQYNNTVAPQRAGAMARSGSFGNSGQQQMQLEDQRNLGQTMANTSNQMRMADYNQQQNMYQQDQQMGLQNRALAQQGTLANRGMDIATSGQDKNYDLGLRSNDFGYAQLDNQINNDNYRNQLNSADFGLRAYNTLQGGNNLGLTAGTQMQNTPMDYQNEFNNQTNLMGGLGGSSSSTQPQQRGDFLSGAMGGLQLYDAYNKFNW